MTDTLPGTGKIGWGEGKMTKREWVRTKKRQRVEKLNRLTITKHKFIGLSLNLRKKMTQPYVQILSCKEFDKVLVGVKPVNKNEPDGHKIGMTCKNGKKLYTSTKFPGLKAGDYHLDWSEEETMWIAKVEEEVKL